MALPRIHCPSCGRELWDDSAPVTPAPGRGCEVEAICIYCLRPHRFISPTRVRTIRFSQLHQAALLQLQPLLIYSLHWCAICRLSYEACIDRGKCKRLVVPDTRALEAFIASRLP